MGCVLVLKADGYGNKAEAHMCKTSAAESPDAILSLTSHFLILVHKECRQFTARAHTHTHTSAPRETYLPLHKLVPVVIRKRSENKGEKDRFLIINFKANASWNFPVWTSGSLIAWISVPLTDELRLWLMFRVIPGPCLTVLLLCFSWGTWEATLQFLSQNWVKNKEPWWRTSKKHMLLVFRSGKPILLCTLPSLLPLCRAPG